MEFVVWVRESPVYPMSQLAKEGIKVSPGIIYVTTTRNASTKQHDCDRLACTVINRIDHSRQGI
jgi:hypothetical protein